MRFSFKHKFLFAFLMIQAVFISLIVFFNFGSLNKLSHSLIDEKIETGTTLFVEMVKTPIMVYDLGTLDDQAKHFVGIRNVVAVKVYDSQRRLLSSLSTEPSLAVRCLEKKSLELETEGRTFRAVCADVTVEGEKIGDVEIVFELTESLQTLQHNRKLTYFLVAVEIFISAFIAYFIGKKLTGSLHYLTTMAEKMAREGDSPEKVFRRGDEVDILTESFMLMQMRVEERDKTLTELLLQYQDSTQQLQTLMDGMTEGVYGVDEKGMCTFVNRSFLQILGYEHPDEVLGKNIHEMIHHSHADGSLYPACECKMLSALKGYPVHSTDEVFWRKDGTAVPVEYWSNPVIMRGGSNGAIATFVDITVRKMTEDELYKLTQAVEQSPSSIVITDREGKIEYVNNAFSRMTGYPLSELKGENPRMLSAGKTSASVYQEMWARLREGETWHGEFINRHKDGTEYIQSIQIFPVYRSDGEITHFIAVEEDITERKKRDARIHYLANFDLLTGVANRANMEEYFKSMLSMTKRSGGSFAVMFLDLDHFKYINDTLGHTAGDKMLIELAERLQAILREEDMISRMGGDEFVILLHGAGIEGAESVARKVLESIAHPFLIDQHELNVSASIGIALYPEDGENIDTLLKNADAAMYRAKQEGRDNYCFFAKEIQLHSVRHLNLLNALRHALERNELYLVYQPQVRLDTNTVIGAEALVRWRHPEYGEVSPAEFIPIAEESGMVIPIGEWILRTAAKQAKVWVEKERAPFTMSVNISAVQFRQFKFSDQVVAILDEEKLPKEHIELELTESATMKDPIGAIAIMNELHEAGIRLSIDDFGTGYSSLSYIKKFKVYKLKIDQSFVRDIITDPEDKAIVGAIINMASSLGLKTIAEGVETFEQLAYLQEQGCDEVQGYYFGKPMLPEAFERHCWKG